jgi:hypothetical protein
MVKATQHIALGLSNVSIMIRISFTFAKALTMNKSAGNNPFTGI